MLTKEIAFCVKLQYIEQSKRRCVLLGNNNQHVQKCSGIRNDSGGGSGGIDGYSRSSWEF